MARVSEGPMAAAVSAAGAFGMIGVGQAATPRYVLDQALTAGAAGKPYGIGLMAWALEHGPGSARGGPGDRRHLGVGGLRGLREPVRRVKAAEKLVTTQVGNLTEARHAVRAGVDFIVARGREAGGHGRDEVGTLPLLQMVLDVVELPVVARRRVPRTLAV
jgi:nitronate monooxygenase